MGDGDRQDRKEATRLFVAAAIPAMADWCLLELWERDVGP